MSFHIKVRPEPSSAWPEFYPPETLRHIGRQVEALLSRHSNLELYRGSIERQLGLIAAHIHEENVLLIPCRVFLLLELRGSGGVSAHLAQIARILREVGYWKPAARVQEYHRQDVYHLGRSAQQLFDDYAALDRRVQQLQALLGHIKEYRRMAPETGPQAVFEDLAMTSDGANVLEKADAVVELLAQTNPAGWFRRLFIHRGGKNWQSAVHKLPVI